MAQEVTIKPKTGLNGRPRPGWIRREDAIYIFAMSPDKFDADVRSVVGSQHYLKVGRATWFDGRELRRIIDAGHVTKPLDRYRTAKAEQAELEVSRRRGELVDASIVKTWLSRMSGRIRQACDVLQRTFGPTAYDIMSEALDDIERTIDDGAISATSGSD